MLESFFLSLKLHNANPNFVEKQNTQSVSREIKQAREILVATNSSINQDFKRFLPKEEETIEAPIIPETSEISKSKFSKFFSKFLVNNSSNVRNDLKDCKKSGGDSILTQGSGGELSFECRNTEDKTIAMEGKTNTPMDQVANDNQEFKARISLGINSKGQSIILYTQNTQKKTMTEEKFKLSPKEKKILYQLKDFIFPNY